MEDDLGGLESGGGLDGLAGMDLSGFSISALIAGLFFGVIGLWLFREGKRRTNHQVMVVGIIMMVYPYFTHGPWIDWVIGAALSAYAYTRWT